MCKRVPALANMNDKWRAQSMASPEAERHCRVHASGQAFEHGKPKAYNRHAVARLYMLVMFCQSREIYVGIGCAKLRKAL